MIFKLLTEHHFEFLSLNGGCRGSSESTQCQNVNCWKSNAASQISFNFNYLSQFQRFFYQTLCVLSQIRKETGFSFFGQGHALGVRLGCALGSNRPTVMLSPPNPLDKFGV